MDADPGLVALEGIRRDFAAFCIAHGRASEADTRVKVIDRILKEVCGWPESSVSREDKTDSGYVDYFLHIRGRPYVTVEAKREGESFVLPTGQCRKRASLQGAIMTDANLRGAVEQVREYCSEQGVRYAIATNGYAWIVFKAVRDDKPWRKGHARVFASIESICEHFTDFWNLVSYEAAATGALDAEFGLPAGLSRNMHRVVGKLANADAPLRRNRLSQQLQPIIKSIFKDIAAQDNIDVFRSCYVHDASLKVVADDINVVISDAIPRFVVEEGGETINQDALTAGRFGSALDGSLESRRGELFLLLGGIGSGKTTFLRRYQRLLGDRTLTEKTYWFHLDFLGSPLDASSLEDFVWYQIQHKLRTDYAGEFLEVRRTVKKAFADKIRALQETALRHVNPDSEQYETELSPYLEQWQKDVGDYLPRLLRYAARTRARALVLFADNVDQLRPDYQRQIFLLAQHVTRALGATTIVALREESYYSATLRQTFTAYTTRKFHIASPWFPRMLGHRLGYAVKEMSRSPKEMSIEALRGQVFDRKDIRDFLTIVERSIVRWRKHIAGFVEAVCFGNMRLALEMFSTFLTSGASDVKKMLRIYRRDGEYHVPFHEFLKSVMLGDRRYYKEDYSPINKPI